MAGNGNTFKIMYKEQEVTVEPVTISGQTLYKAMFPDKPSIIIHQARDRNGDLFWTSIPEGRQKMAMDIGELIQAWLASHQPR